MAKVRVLGTPLGDEGKRVQPTGYIGGQEWAAIGEEMDLDDAAAAAMAEVGTVELLDGKTVQKRPASKKAEETR